MQNKRLDDTELYESTYGYKERNSNFRFYIVLLALVAVFFCFRIYFTNAFGGVVVDGPSMNVTLYDGEQLLMRYTNARTKADYGDVIIVDVRNYDEFSSKSDPDFLIKRLIAKEHDNVKCVDGQVYIQYGGTGDFIPLDEPYAYYSGNKANYDFDVYEVGEGEVFFLGDNRQNSCDSRYNTGGGSRLDDKLYKEEDIYGVVPQWAITHQKLLAFFFFPSTALKGGNGD